MDSTKDLISFPRCSGFCIRCITDLYTFLQTEIDEGAKGGCHGKCEYDIVLFRTQPDPRQDNDH